MGRRDNGAGAASILMAFVLGAITGAATALMYAPGPGSETRELLARKAREGRERAQGAAERGREKINHSRETLATAIEKGREAYKEARGREQA